MKQPATRINRIKTEIRKQTNQQLETVNCNQSVYQPLKAQCKRCSDPHKQI